MGLFCRPVEAGLSAPSELESTFSVSKGEAIHDIAWFPQMRSEGHTAAMLIGASCVGDSVLCRRCIVLLPLNCSRRASAALGCVHRRSHPHPPP